MPKRFRFRTPRSIDSDKWPAKIKIRTAPIWTNLPKMKSKQSELSNENDSSLFSPIDDHDHDDPQAVEPAQSDQLPLKPASLPPAIPLNSTQFVTESSYFNALEDEKVNGSVQFLPNDWILLQDFVIRGAPEARDYRLARSRYVLISVANGSIVCNCGAANNCLHVAYILFSVRSRNSSSSASSSLSNSLVFPIHNFTEKPHFVKIIRDYGIDSSIRRLFCVILNSISVPVLVVQNNNESNPWTCRHCAPDNCCNHIAAAFRYCKENHNEENPIGAVNYKSKRKERDLNCRVSWLPLPPPFAISTRSEAAEAENNQMEGISWRSRTKSEIETYESVIRGRFPIHLMERVCLNKECQSHKLPIPSMSIHSSSTVDGTLFLSNAVFKVLISSSQCNLCGSVFKYDGRADGIFNYNNSLLFSHSLLNSFTTRFSHHTCPFTAFVSTQLMDYENAGVAPGSFISVPTFIKVWFSFSQLQQWKFEFSCVQCGARPRLVFCDGTGLSIKLSKSGSLQPPTRIDPDLPYRLPTAVKWSEIIAFPNRVKEIRIGLNKILECVKRAGRLSSGLTVLEREEELKKAKEILDNIEGGPFTWPLFGELYELLVYGSFPYFTTWMEISPEKVDSICFIIHYLSKEESLMSLIPPFVFDICSKIINFPAEVPLVWQNELHNARPMLYDIFHSFSLFNGTNHRTDNQRSIIKFLQELLLRAQSIIRQFNAAQAKADQSPRPPLPNTHLSDFERLKTATMASEFTGKYYGKLQRQRVMQHYEGIDSPGSEYPPAKEPAACSSDRYYTKAGKQKRNFTGGIMAFWCEHGVCLGFHMMSGAGESPADVMRAILSYWDKAPDVIVYDRACELMHYCHRREWEFFKNITFLVDEFHTYGHTKCSKVHSMKSFKQGRSHLFLFKNCSISESCNFGLTKIRTSCYFCAAPTAFLMTMGYMEIHNVRKIHNLKRRLKERTASSIADYEHQLDKSALKTQLFDYQEFPGEDSGDSDSNSDSDYIF